MSGLEDLWAVLEEADRDPTAAGENGGYTLLEHLLQCADLLGRARPEDVELQLAGLVHDIGHVLDPGDEEGHGRVGADFVRPRLGGRVAELVALHVPAKRYLVSLDPHYADGLSVASRSSLVAQGDLMTAFEQRAFEGSPHARDALVLRRADDGAKVAGRRPQGLDAWRNRLAAQAARATRITPDAADVRSHFPRP